MGEPWWRYIKVTKQQIGQELANPEWVVFLEAKIKQLEAALDSINYVHSIDEARDIAQKALGG